MTMQKHDFPRQNSNISQGQFYNLFILSGGTFYHGKVIVIFPGGVSRPLGGKSYSLTKAILLQKLKLRNYCG